jgi:HAD superfamily hydrolase (TIGR01484 family)
MLFCALASDYDGTLASEGRVAPDTVRALERFKATGKRLILVTGRELKDLRAVFEPIRLFDVIIAENGAVLYRPATQEERALAAAPPERLIAALRAKDVKPLSIGRSVIATWTPNETAVLAAIRELGLDWQLTFNKGAVMCLPPGTNKASGLAAALEDLKLSPHNVVGIGDAENDQAFLSTCGCSVAVANALDTVKDNVDFCTAAARGAGVAELIDRWLDEARGLFSHLRRHDIRLGEAIGEGTAVMLPSDRGAVLIAGASGVGKTALTHLLLERMAAGRYQACIVDPEGDYDESDDVAHVGGADRTPSPVEVMSLLEAPGTSVAVNLLGLDISQRPGYFSTLMGQISGLRAATGRPHWLILDETHHLAPNTQEFEHTALPDNLSATIYITTRPRNLSQSVLRSIRTLLAVGRHSGEVLEEFCGVLQEPTPAVPDALPDDAVLVWDRDRVDKAFAVTVGQAKHRHRRHTRKYAEGRLGEDKSFYFRGAAGALNLRAYNLATFLHLAAGIDDETWFYHLKRGDYTTWFRDAIKDEGLAAEVLAIESNEDAADSRRALADAITRRYAAADLG